MSITFGFVLFTFVLGSLSGRILRDHPIREYFKLGLAISLVLPVVSSLQGTDVTALVPAMLCFQTGLLAGSIAIRQGMPRSGPFDAMIAFRIVMFASAMMTVGVSTLVWFLFIR